MMIVARLNALLFALPLLGCGDEGSIAPPPPPPVSGGLTLATVASGLDTPVFLTAPPGDDRLFVVEKRGRIRIIDDGTVRPTPFLDLTALVSNGGEQGLLGLAFHPDYATNGVFVVDYTDGAGNTRVASYRVSTQDPDRADPGSGHVLLAVAQPYSNHNGGMLAFGPEDGHLYVALGDGGSAGDPQSNGQDRNTLLGSLVRLAVDAAGQGSIPADNPFVGQAGARAEIWSYGLRNPWRFSFDRANGDLYIGDVGQGQREEIDVSRAADGAGRGLNFGWNVMEGGNCYSPSSGCDRSGLTLPVLEYGHGPACSVTGGYVYRGAAVASLRGTYFYADYCAGWVRSFRLESGQAAEQREWTDLSSGGRITSFGEDAAGELYLLTENGRVSRIVPR
ncbi:MAG: sorbosone dehydrogenase family protein [Gemmatimonadales bacterium]